MVVEYGYYEEIDKAHLSMITVSKYNQKGNHVETSYLKSDSSLMSKAEAHHLPNGEIRSTHTVHSEGEHDLVHNHKYDKNSNRIETTTLNKEGKVQTVFRYTYNEKDQLIQDVSGPPGAPAFQLNYSYNDAGNLAEMKELDLKTKKPGMHVFYKYKEFDKENNWTLREDSINVKSKCYTIRRIEYFQ
ncbi:MAG: hypothetical protein K0S32_3053 [Bacteroidetes bacterium]|nr:hypothetical protein [Bacteroidota bacterium]